MAGITPGVRLETYEIVAPIASGGMGEVWLARDLRLDRKVAIKILPADVTRDEGRVARFRQEARTASALNHPNVCAIHTLGEADDGRVFIAMEYVDGETLRERLARGRFTVEDAVRIGVQIASAVSAAHAAGVVHRDIKPENVMVRPDGVVKVLDFGLAKLAPIPVAAAVETTRTMLQTAAGTVMGTVAYMSPEQACGQEVDTRTDIWSLGVVLYEFIAGRLPFGGVATSDVLLSILDRKPAPLSHLVPAAPRELQRIVSKALRKDREKRYQSAKDLLLDLETLGDELQTGGLSAGPQHADAEPTVASRRYKPLAAAALAALLLAMGLGGWWALGLIREQRAHGRPAVLTSRGLRRLTFDPGLQSEITWSPDGRFIAYASDKEGNFDIWVQPVDTGAAWQLTKSPAHDRQPSWSPDGKNIVFRSERDGGGLFVIPAGGGAERRLTTFGVEPKWAPDGSQIMFASTSVYALYVPRLFTVRLDGRPPQPVLEPFLRNLRYVVSWTWYPDSTRVSILGATKFGGEGLGVYTVPLSGEGPALLKYTPEVGTWGAFEWSRSGKTLYLDCDSNAAHGVCKFDVDPSTMTIRSTQRLTAGAGFLATPAVSSDGKRLAYTMTRGTVRLWSFPFDSGTRRVAGEGEAVTEADLYVRTWSLSYDGTRVAYAADRAGMAKTQLWTTDLIAGKHRQLTDDDQARVTPQWSRDGSMLVYDWYERAADQNSAQALAILRMSGGEEQVISTPQVAPGWPAAPSDWSPDGRWILASSLLPRTSVHSLSVWPLAAAPRAETGVRTLAYDPDYDLWQAKYSPDGKWICFIANEREVTTGNTIFVMPSRGAKRVQWTPLTDSREWVDKPRWSSDGTLVYFVRYRNSFFNLWAVRFDSAVGTPVGEPFQITRFESPTRQISTDLPNAEVGVSRNRLILSIMEQAGNIWVMDNIDQ